MGNSPKVNTVSSVGYSRGKPGAKLETSIIAHLDYSDDDSLSYSTVQ